MIYVIAIILGVILDVLLAYVSFMAGSMHGYSKGFNECVKITNAAFDEISEDLNRLIAERKEDDNNI